VEPLGSLPLRPLVTQALSPEERAARWDAAYEHRGVDGVSWYQPTPEVSLQLIDALRVSPMAAVVDVGGGASSLAEQLVRRGYSDVTVLDISRSALEGSRKHLADPATVSYVHDDLLAWHPSRRYDLWHDRAVYHFLIDEEDRRRYAKTLRNALPAGGFVIIATFAPDGPSSCSGLPVVRYSADALAQTLGNPFVQLEERREEHITPRGSVQPFTWIAGRLGPRRP
jgi:SAM-dependent methyltransferase